MTELDLEKTNVGVTTSVNPIIDKETIEATSYSVPMMVPSDTSVEVSKKEWSVVSDGLYASVNAAEAPLWLTSIIDEVVTSGLANSNTSLTEANQNIINSLSELEIAKNSYNELINISATVDQIISSRLQSLDASLANSNAKIVGLETAMVTPDMAMAMSASLIEASVNGGSIAAKVGRVESTLVNQMIAQAATVDILEADFENARGELNSAVSTLENSVAANAEKAEANFAYNATLGSTYNGVKYYYNSGFGLKTTLAGSTDPNNPATGSSEFWVNADKFKVTGNGTTANPVFEVDGNNVNILGNVRISGAADAPKHTSGNGLPSGSAVEGSTYLDTSTGLVWIYRSSAWRSTEGAEGVSILNNISGLLSPLTKYTPFIHTGSVSVVDDSSALFGRAISAGRTSFSGTPYFSLSARELEDLLNTHMAGGSKWLLSAYVRVEGASVTYNVGVFNTPYTGSSTPLAAATFGTVSSTTYQRVSALIEIPSNAVGPFGIRMNPRTSSSTSNKVFTSGLMLEPYRNTLEPSPYLPSSLGSAGDRGPGFFKVGTGTGDWSNATALTALPKGYPVKDDTVTIFKTDDPKVANTRMWNGVDWVPPALSVHGDMVVDGTLNASKIGAGVLQVGVFDAFSLPAGYSGTVIDKDGLSVYSNGALRVRVGKLT
jgi:hypothetical protein